MKVLVVVDMQNDFIDGALGTPEAQASIRRTCTSSIRCQPTAHSRKVIVWKK